MYGRFWPHLAWLCLLLLLLPAGQLHAQGRVIVPLTSTPGPNEFDTAGPHGVGQAGGIRPRFGINYTLEDLRCPGVARRSSACAFGAATCWTTCRSSARRQPARRRHWRLPVDGLYLRTFSRQSVRRRSAAADDV